MKDINKQVLRWGFALLFVWLLAGFFQFTPDVKDPEGATEMMENEWESEEQKKRGEAAILLGQALRCDSPDNYVITVVGLDGDYYCQSDPFYQSVYWLMAGGGIFILTCLLSLSLSKNVSESS